MTGTEPVAGSDQVIPLMTGHVDPITAARLAFCPCHEAVDCPDQATVTICAAELTVLGELLSDIDEFLRCGNDIAERLADFYAHRGHPHPRFAANNLIDAVGFAALRLRHLDDTGHGDSDGEAGSR